MCDFFKIREFDLVESGRTLSHGHTVSTDHISLVEIIDGIHNQVLIDFLLVVLLGVDGQFSKEGTFDIIVFHQMRGEFGHTVTQFF